MKFFSRISGVCVYLYIFVFFFFLFGWWVNWILILLFDVLICSLFITFSYFFIRFYEVNIIKKIVCILHIRMNLSYTLSKTTHFNQQSIWHSNILIEWLINFNLNWFFFHYICIDVTFVLWCIYNSWIYISI